LPAAGPWAEVAWEQVDPKACFPVGAAIAATSTIGIALERSPFRVNKADINQIY
jgi:hypothetical protein